MIKDNLPVVITKQNPLIWSGLFATLGVILGGVILRRRG